MDHSGQNPGSERSGGGVCHGRPSGEPPTREVTTGTKEECQFQKLEEAKWGLAGRSRTGVWGKSHQVWLEVIGELSRIRWRVRAS